MSRINVERLRNSVEAEIEQKKHKMQLLAIN
jgi:hypothetical protein